MDSKARSENWPVENACFGLKKCLELNSLRRRRLEVVGERENGRARGRHARGEVSPRVSPTRANVFSCAAPATQAGSWKTRQHTTAKNSLISPHKFIWEI